MNRASWACLSLLVALPGFCGADWTSFRGPTGNWVARDANLPTTWSDKENIAWKAALPGRGLSTPIIVGDRVFVTCSSGYRQDRLHVICFDATTGKKRFERQFWATGRTMSHPKTSVAAPSPVSDGKRVFALYSTNDLVALDLDGNLLWLRGLTVDYPNASNSLGMASSPAVANDTLVVQLDNDSQQSLALGIDVETGKNRWKIDRPSQANWTSPVVLPGDSPDRNLVVLQSGIFLCAVEPATGKEVWRYAQGCATIPSLGVAEDRRLFVPSNGVAALRHNPGSQSPEQLWQTNRLRPSTPSVVVVGNRLYAMNGSVLTAADTETGEVTWQLRLKGSFTSTPIAAGGHLYLFNEEGVGQVVRLDEKAGEVVGSSELGETILCTPAVSNGGLYVRSDGHLWKIARTKS